MKYQVLPLGRNNLMLQHRLERSSAEKDLGVLVDNKLTMSQQRVFLAKVANSLVGYGRQRVPSRLRETILPLCSVPGRHIWGAGISPVQGGHGETEVSPAKGATRMIKGLEHLA